MSKINLALSVVLFTALSCQTSKENKEVSYPVAKKDPHVFTDHGIERVDNYYWLRERENPEVIAYLNAENAYADEGLKDVKGLREKLFEEMKGRIAQTDMSVPYNYKGYSYYSRYEEGKEYPFVCRKKFGSGEELVMIDVNELASAYSYYGMGDTEISNDNKILAFGEDTLSRRIYSLRFKNLETGEILPDVLQGTTGSAVFSKDGSTVFYTAQDAQTLRSYQVYRHKMGSAQADDELIFEEKDDTFSVEAYLSKSGDYIIVSSTSTLTTEYSIIKADEPQGQLKLVQPRVRGLEYHISHFGNYFYIVNNADGARNFKLSKAPVSNPGKENWKDIIPHREDVLLESMEIFRDYLVLQERKDGLGMLRVMPWDKPQDEHYITFNDPSYMVYISTNKEFSTDTLRYGYSSLTTPNSIFDYDMKTHQAKLMKQQEVVGGFEPSDYISERLFAKANDGTKVPISVVYKKGFVRNGNQPLLLYGYGSYGINMDAAFRLSLLSLLDRGFAFAIANIRGGQEMGRDWYESGKLLKKKNTFTDFIDCAEYLIAEDYTSKEHLYAMGGSAGGLLMGAVVNLRPDLWNGVVAQVPFVDVMTTMLDASIPLTTGEYDEWGNPNEKKSFDYMMTYSPYDNVDSVAYPNMLITTGLHDSQVQYWEPAKWVAKLRDFKTDTNSIFLVTNMDAGHGGASGRFERLKETALDYAFLLKMEGKTE